MHQKKSPKGTPQENAARERRKREEKAPSRGNTAWGPSGSPGRLARQIFRRPQINELPERRFPVPPISRSPARQASLPVPSGRIESEFDECFAHRDLMGLAALRALQLETLRPCRAQAFHIDLDAGRCLLACLWAGEQERSHGLLLLLETDGSCYRALEPATLKPATTGGPTAVAEHARSKPHRDIRRATNTVLNRTVCADVHVQMFMKPASRNDSGEVSVLFRTMIPMAIAGRRR